MRIIKLALAVSTVVCLALTSTLARESDNRGSSGSKTRASKQGKTSRSKTATAKRKASAAARKAAAKKASAKRKAPSQLRSTGDIDVRGTVWGELPLEELPASETDQPDDEELLPEP